MKKTLNLPRIAVKDSKLDWKSFKTEVAWISIGEPEKSFEHIQNETLDKCAKLKIRFHDLCEPIESTERELFPPTRKIAHKIVRFILDNKDKNFVVNCAAGISRSGAVCKFLEDVLGYKWIEFGKELALPNMLLYDLLVEAYNENLIK
jgi:predicted protein tyrosine phosphatase